MLGIPFFFFFYLNALFHLFFIHFVAFVASQIHVNMKKRYINQNLK